MLVQIDGGDEHFATILIHLNQMLPATRSDYIRDVSGRAVGVQFECPTGLKESATGGDFPHLMRGLTHIAFLAWDCRTVRGTYAIPGDFGVRVVVRFYKGPLDWIDLMSFHRNGAKSKVAFVGATSQSPLHSISLELSDERGGGEIGLFQRPELLPDVRTGKISDSAQAFYRLYPQFDLDHILEQED